MPSLVYEYSHKLIAKYSDPTVSWPVASDNGVLLFIHNVSKTSIGELLVV